jgi:hypothetical protein
MKVSDDGAVTEFVPFMFSGSPEHIAQMIRGRLPQVGDVVEMVCYEVIEKDGTMFVKCHWQVQT